MITTFFLSHKGKRSLSSMPLELWLGFVSLASLLLLAGCTPTPESSTLSKSWITTLPGSTITSPRLTTDADGNVYACGVFHDSLTLGSFQMKAKDHYALYLAQLDTTGKYKWAHQVGQAKPGLTLSTCKTDQEGNLLLTGYYYKDMAFKDIKLPTQQGTYTNAFLVRVSPSGEVLWAHGVLGSRGAQGTSIAVSPTGEFWWTGYFQNTGVFQDIRLQTQQANQPQAFLARLNKAGKYLRVITIPGYSIGTDITINTAGRITLAGIFQKMIIVGSQTHISRGLSDIFVTQLSKEARVLWSTSLGGRSNDNGVGVASGQDGQLYVHATLGGYAQIGEKKHHVKDGTHHILVKIGPNGKIVFSREIATVQQESPMLYERLSVSVSAQNNVYLLTEHNTPNHTQFNFALSIVPNLEGTSYQSIIPQPSGQGVMGKDLVLDAQGHAIVTGWLQGSATLQQHQINDTGKPRAFIWRTN